MFNITNGWSEIVRGSLNEMDNSYLEFLEEDEGYFPCKNDFLNAFKTLDLKETKYILFGQDPYPREQSAIGYAFIDGAVPSLWDEKGNISKAANRATSLRNFLKMIFVSEDRLGSDTSKEAVAAIDKSGFISSILELRDNFEKNGVLLLNTALIFTDKESSKYHVKMWKPFVEALLKKIEDHDIELILFGNLAKEIDKLKGSEKLKKHYFEHPYNVSFIQNEEVHRLFKPMRLLER